jgi:adenosylhomocysteine nucleosidase
MAKDIPYILFAMRRESRPFLRTFPFEHRLTRAPCWVAFCGGFGGWSVLAAEIGIGQGRAVSALDWLLRTPKLHAFHPRFILSAGFSGALQKDLHVGDVLLATEVVDLQGNCHRVTWPADEGKPSLRAGRLLSLATLLGDAEEKCRLGQQHAALAVDMETAAVAEFCTRRNIPFGCLRVISDECHVSLSPYLAALLTNGKTSAWRAARALWQQPGLFWEFWRLARDTRFAARQLAKSLEMILSKV